MAITYSGRVFDRKSGSPLSDIPVSDGRNIVFTDENGRFELSGWERAHIINVASLTQRHCDWYIPISGHEGDFNFYIELCDTASENFSFLHTSDTEIENRPENEWIGFAKKTAKERSSAFLMHTGDLCREDGVKRHYLAMNRETVGCPVRYCIGNHDFIGDEYGEEIYEKLYGPTWYSFDYGNIHFAVLSIGAGDNKSGYSPDDQWEWLMRDIELLSNGKKLIICCHDLCAYDPTGFTRKLGDKTVDLKEKGLAAWVFGHYHINISHEYEGVYNLSTARPDSGGIDSSPAGLREISVCDNKLSTSIIYYIPDGAQKDDCIWSTQLDGNVEFSSLIHSGGYIYAATSNDSLPGRCGITKLCAKSGKTEWFFETKGGIKGDMAYDSGRIYAQDTYGTVYCINEADATVVWTAKCKLLRSGFTRMGVTAAENLIIAGSPSYLHAFDKESGKLVWENLVRGCEATPAKIVFDANKKRLYASLHWYALLCYDLYTGKVLWENTDRPHCWYRSSTPYLYENTLYFGGLYNIAAVSAEDGKTVVSKPSHGRMDVCGGPAFDGKTFFFPTGDKGVIGYDKETLEVTKNFACSVSRLFTSPYLYGKVGTVEAQPQIISDMLIFTAADGYIYIYDKNTAELKKKISMGAPSTVPPLLIGNTVITADFCGNISCFAL